MVTPRLADRTALVFGGGQIPGEDVGNGRAAALVYARHGARVVVVDRDLGSAEETVAMIEADGGEGIAVRADVTDETQVRAAVDRCTGAFGRIDVLHNNVGVNHGDGVLTDVAPETFDRMMAINLRGTYLACLHTLPVMVEQGRGVVVNIASTAPIMSYPFAAYQVSKSGVLMLTKHIAIQYAPSGIRANAILPGLINTPMAIEHQVGRPGATRESVLSARRTLTPLKDVVATGFDVANAALFLASDDARFITGTELVIDGGQSLRIG
jgi:NAD(P)-dependent dehydrogenase (short-subunit alcohol dehydrogenase family)